MRKRQLLRINIDSAPPEDLKALIYFHQKRAEIAEAAVRQLYDLVGKLVDRLDVALPAVDAAVLMQSLQQRPYRGTSIADELAAARMLLSTAAPARRKSKDRELWPDRKD